MHPFLGSRSELARVTPSWLHLSSSSQVRAGQQHQGTALRPSPPTACWRVTRRPPAKAVVLGQHPVGQHRASSKRHPLNSGRVRRRRAHRRTGGRRPAVRRRHPERRRRRLRRPGDRGPAHRRDRRRREGHPHHAGRATWPPGVPLVESFRRCVDLLEGSVAMTSTSPDLLFALRPGALRRPGASGARDREPAARPTGTSGSMGAGGQRPRRSEHDTRRSRLARPIGLAGRASSTGQRAAAQQPGHEPGHGLSCPLPLRGAKHAQAHIQPPHCFPRHARAARARHRVGCARIRVGQAAARHSQASPPASTT